MMDREAIFRILLSHINELGGRDYDPADVDRSRSPADYGVDSLNVMQILTELEGALDFEIDLGQLSESDFASIDSVLDYLERLQLENASSQAP